MARVHQSHCPVNKRPKFEYRGWTSDDLVRHASFKGSREDKHAREVTKETRGL
jgi:ATP-dependent DNA ligase